MRKHAVLGTLRMPSTLSSTDQPKGVQGLSRYVLGQSRLG